VLARRADIHGVAHRIGAESHGIFDGCEQRRGGVRIAGDVGLAVELQDQRNLPAPIAHVFLGQTDAQRDSRKIAFHREPELVLRIDRGGIREEIGRAVLQSLVQWQHEQAAVARAVAIHHRRHRRVRLPWERESFENFSEAFERCCNSSFISNTLGASSDGFTFERIEQNVNTS
jgi:hypothetical protein